ncbi:MAG: hypothetical protein K8S87_12545 [Planctomycetes bacterium]|nr:hypothetical protein [Planctomycetota bacterium]
MTMRYTDQEVENLVRENEKLKLQIQELKNAGTGDNFSGPGMSIVGLNDRIIQLDVNNRVLYVNRSMLQLLGNKNREYFIGKTLAEIDRLPWGAGLLGRLLNKARKDGSLIEERKFTDPVDEEEKIFQFQVSITPKATHFVIHDITEQKNVKEAFSRMVSPDIMTRVLEMGKDLSKAEKYEMSVLFGDLRGFTTYSEGLDPNQVRESANEFLSVASSIVLQYHGTIDKYIGDEIMAIFGAPYYFEDHYIKALNCAIRMQQEHQRLMDRWKQSGKPAIPMGIGINTGEMVIGLVGSEKRMDYTVLGHPVNLAARLCSLAPKNQIWIGPKTFDSIRCRVQEMGEEAGVEGDIKFKPAGQIKVKGITEPVSIISVNIFD